MIKVLRNQLFAIPEQGGQWLRNVQPGDPFANFKLTKKVVEKVALTEAELNWVIEKKFDTERLCLVRDLFVLAVIPVWLTPM